MASGREIPSAFPVLGNAHISLPESPARPNEHRCAAIHALRH